MNSPDHSTKGTPLAWLGGGEPPSALCASDCLWVLGFRVSFIPLAGCFSPFPHGTRALSVARGSLALEGGPPCFPQDFACPVVLRHTATAPVPVGYGALTRSRPASQPVRLFPDRPAPHPLRPTTPPPHHA